MTDQDTKSNIEDPLDLPDPDLKIILLGDSAVGKSKLIERYLMDEYNPRQVLFDY
jgi:Rab-like protein 2